MKPGSNLEVNEGLLDNKADLIGGVTIKRRKLLPDYYGRVDPPTFTGTYTEAWGPILATCAAPPPSPAPPPPPSPPPPPPSPPPPNPFGILIIPPGYQCLYFGLHSAEKTTCEWYAKDYLNYANEMLQAFGEERTTQYWNPGNVL